MLPHNLPRAKEWPARPFDNASLYAIWGGWDLRGADHNSSNDRVFGGPSKLKAMASIASNLTLGQARFALSSQQTWNGKDGAFDYEAFFETLLQLFELDPEWKEETLCWWNQ